VDVTAWSKGLSVEVGGHGVVSHVGSGLLRLAADRVGLTSALSTALHRPGFWPVEIDTLRHQGELFGSVAADLQRLHSGLGYMILNEVYAEHLNRQLAV
jgi:hypothetical protein